MGAPLLVCVEPFEEGLLEGTQLPVVVLRLTLDRGRAGQFRPWVDQLVRIEGTPTVVALISPGIDIPAVWAGAFDVSVGEKPFRLLVIELARGFSVEVAVLEEPQEELLSHPRVVFRARRGEEIEGDT